MRGVACGLVLSLGVAACAQQTSPLPEKNWQQLCESAKAQPLTPMQPAGPLAASQLAHCDETALYYGLGEKPDYAAALQCGWYERAHPESVIANMFYGPGVLTMLYANGLGVRRDYALAIRFACENQWAAPAEFESRIGHLEYLRDHPAESKAFDLCDDITSGLSGGFCTSVQTRTRDAVRSRQIAAIIDRLPAVAKTAFPSLQAAEAAFEQARSGNEVDLSGTLRAAFELEEEAKLRDQFLINLQRFGKPDIPAASTTDLASLDRQLNEVYQQLQHAPASKWDGETIKPEGIRDTERKWLSLVDAWMNFGHAAYPNLSPTRMRAQLIRLRLHQLRSLAGN